MQNNRRQWERSQELVRRVDNLHPLVLEKLNLIIQHGHRYNVWNIVACNCRLTACIGRMKNATFYWISFSRLLVVHLNIHLFSVSTMDCQKLFFFFPDNYSNKNRIHQMINSRRNFIRETSKSWKNYRIIRTIYPKNSSTNRFSRRFTTPISPIMFARVASQTTTGYHRNLIAAYDRLLLLTCEAISATINTSI